jgi:hypothetical protein
VKSQLGVRNREVNLCGLPLFLRPRGSSLLGNPTPGLIGGLVSRSHAWAWSKGGEVHGLDAQDVLNCTCNLVILRVLIKRVPWNRRKWAQVQGQDSIQQDISKRLRHGEGKQSTCQRLAVR